VVFGVRLPAISCYASLSRALRATEYAWSSHRANARGVPDPLIVPHEIYLRLGRLLEDRRLSYRQLFGVPVNAEELETIRETTNKAWVLGNDRFCARVEELAGCGVRDQEEPERKSKRMFKRTFLRV